jgi:hypothetical protein
MSINELPRLDELVNSGLHEGFKIKKVYSLQPDTPNRVAFLGFPTPDAIEPHRFVRIITLSIKSLQFAWELMDGDKFQVRVVPVSFQAFVDNKGSVCWDLHDLEGKIQHNETYRQVGGGDKFEGWRGLAERLFTPKNIEEWSERHQKPTWSIIVPNHELDPEKYKPSWKPVPANEEEKPAEAIPVP